MANSRNMANPRGAPNQTIEEQGELVWEGQLGTTFLRVDILHSGRLAARWKSHGNDRRVIVDTETELERRVLFGLMVGADQASQATMAHIMAAVSDAKVGRPDPTQAPRRKKKRTRPSRRGMPRPRRR